MSLPMVTKWLWDFGDGNTSVEQNPNHLYVNPGVYTVSLTATNPSGSDTEVMSSLITAVSDTVIPGAPVTSFTASPVTGTSPLTVAFTDTSSNTPTSWVWNFGDNTSSNIQNPTHTYSTPGDYTVVLTTSNAINSNTLMKVKFIKVSSNIVAVTPPIAAFTHASLGVTNAGRQESFSNTSSNATSYLWDFGDGFTSTETNPLHSYTSIGNFTVVLVATNNVNGQILKNSANATVQVTQVVPTPPPVASFTTSSVSGITPLVVVFTDTSTGNPTAWLWDFGDGTTSTLQNP